MTEIIIDNIGTPTHLHKLHSIKLDNWVIEQCKKLEIKEYECGFSRFDQIVISPNSRIFAFPNHITSYDEYGENDNKGGSFFVIRDLITGTILNFLDFRMANISTYSFNNSGSHFYASYGDKKILSWSTYDFKLVKTYEHSEVVRAISFTNEDRLLICGGKKISFIDTNTSELIKEFSFKPSDCYWCKDLKKEIRFATQYRKNAERKFKSHLDSSHKVKSLMLTADGSKLISEVESELIVWKVKLQYNIDKVSIQIKKQKSLTNNWTYWAFISPKISPDQTRIVAGSSNYETDNRTDKDIISSWTLDKLKREDIYDFQTGKDRIDRNCKDLTISPNGRYLIIAMKHYFRPPGFIVLDIKKKRVSKVPYDMIEKIAKGIDSLASINSLYFTSLQFSPDKKWLIFRESEYIYILKSNHYFVEEDEVLEELESKLKKESDRKFIINTQNRINSLIENSQDLNHLMNDSTFKVQDYSWSQDVIITKNKIIQAIKQIPNNLQPILKEIEDPRLSNIISNEIIDSVRNIAEMSVQAKSLVSSLKAKEEELVQHEKELDVVRRFIEKMNNGDVISLNILNERTLDEESKTQTILLEILKFNPALGKYNLNAQVFTRIDPTVEMKDAKIELTIRKILEDRACCKMAGRFGDQYCNTCGRVILDEWIL